MFFDGDCGVCSASVRWIYRLDREARITFSPLQGRLAAECGLSANSALDDGTMVILRESDGRVFTRSDALIELARALGGVWKIFALAQWIPRSSRDAVYRWVARNRLRLMGRPASCVVPDPGLAGRMRG